VQADILKEDQAQNTCLFATDFSLKLMGDIQQYFIDNNVRNYYSVSIQATTLLKLEQTHNATCLYSCKRLYLCGILPCKGNEDR